MTGRHLLETEKAFQKKSGFHCSDLTKERLEQWQPSGTGEAKAWLQGCNPDAEVCKVLMCSKGKPVTVVPGLGLG